MEGLDISLICNVFDWYSHHAPRHLDGVWIMKVLDWRKGDTRKVARVNRTNLEHVCIKRRSNIASRRNILFVG